MAQVMMMMFDVKSLACGPGWTIFTPKFQVYSGKTFPPIFYQSYFKRVVRCCNVSFSISDM